MLGKKGIADVEPWRCGCDPLNPLEHDRGEITWYVEKCRFSEGAKRSLVAACATIHHRIAPLVDLVLE